MKRIVFTLMSILFICVLAFLSAPAVVAATSDLAVYACQSGSSVDIGILEALPVGTSSHSPPDVILSAKENNLKLYSVKPDVTSHGAYWPLE